MSVWNFTFGSHLCRAQFKRIIGNDPLDVVNAVLHDHRLTFWKLTKFPKEYAHLATGGGPALVPQERGCVYGVAYLISPAQFDIVDRYEEMWGYKRFQCEVETESGTPLTVEAHNLVHQNGFAPPAKEFLELMLKGLEEHGYSESILRHVKQTALDP